MAEKKDDSSECLHDEWQIFKKSVRKISNKKTYARKTSIKKQDELNLKQSISESDDSYRFKKDYGKFTDDNLVNTSSQIEIDNFKGVDKNLYRNIISGKVAPDAKLDLHGYTIVKAHNAVINFITKCFINKNRLVLIVTGKGRDDSQNTIRGNLERFLNSTPINNMILFASKASSRHGGGGAFYVFLRKYDVNRA